MSRYYIYDSYTDSVAEFAERRRRRRSSAGPAPQGPSSMYPQRAPQGPSSPIGARQGAYQTLDQRPTGMGQKIKDLPSNTRRSIGSAVDAARTPYGKYGNNASPLREVIGRTGQVWRSGAAGKAGLIGAGALAAGALAGGAMAANKRSKKKQQERNSIKGRVKALLGR